MSFIDPWRDAYSSGYQLTHSLIGFGRGELFGVGLGSSIQKHDFLPAAHNDFILAIIAEETGFFGRGNHHVTYRCTGAQMSAYWS